MPVKAKLHFYDIESLQNVFTLTNYLPEENKVEQFFLLSSDLRKKLTKEAGGDLKKALGAPLTHRVRLRNANFNPGLKTYPGRLSTGTSEPLDLSKPNNNLRLAYEFGVSTARDVCDPTDATSIYPAGLRPMCETDKDNGTGLWKPAAVLMRWGKKLRTYGYSSDPDISDLENELITGGKKNKYKLQRMLAALRYQNFDVKPRPYLLGYNSDNYDLTILSVYLQDLFTSAVPLTEDDLKDFAFSQNDHGYHFYRLTPDTPAVMRHINNLMFTKEYMKQMPSILYNEPKDEQGRRMHLRNAFLIRKNMLRSGRHLDVSQLNEKMRKVGLKRLLGMKGFQILQSSKLRLGADHIENLDQFYDLLAYNASDCINLAALFNDNQYQGQFDLKRSLLKTYPMTVYQKQQDKYAPDIAPDKVKTKRMLIDSSSADIATNVVCPYGHLDDIPAVSFRYPEKRKAAETHIPQFNVLRQTMHFFDTRVFGPAAKINLQRANKDREAFMRVMHWYGSIEGHNFNDSRYYYAKQLGKANPDISQDFFNSLTDDDWTNVMNNINSFDLLLLQKKNKSLVNKVYVRCKDKNIAIPAEFIARNVIDVKHPAPDVYPLELQDLTSCLHDLCLALLRESDAKLRQAGFSKINELAKPWKEEQLAIKKREERIQKKNKQGVYQTLANKGAKVTQQEEIEDQNRYQVFRASVDKWLANVFEKPEWVLETWNQNLCYNWWRAKIVKKIRFDDNGDPIKEDNRVYPLYLRPYTNKDLPRGNYCLPFYNKDGSPSRGYAVFSVGGIHGAEYNYDLYQYDKTHVLPKGKENKHAPVKGQTSLFSPAQGTQPQKQAKVLNPDVKLFTQKKSGNYELNSRYVYTSLDPVNHEDFSSYYPSMCRMLNVYWNDGIGKDIYGEVYDRKQKLGDMMVDPKYTAKQRDYYHDMRQGTKLILNSTTGKGDSHGQNSPIQMNNNIMSMRLIGQMFTWRIGQAQTLAGAKVVSTNTDGLYTVLDNVKLNKQILDREVKEIHVRIDPARLYLISKDSNNREEEDVKTLKVNVPSGGNLIAFNGPTTTRALNHPAAIDRALGLYLREMGNKNSKYYDQKLMKPFNRKLALHILTHLYGDLSKLPKGKQLGAKRKLLNLFQNVIASSPGVDSYNFISKKYLQGLNSAGIPDEYQKQVDESASGNSSTVIQKFSTKSDDGGQAISLLFNPASLASKLDMSNFKVIQPYNRIFYVKPGTKDSVHIYRAVGRKVNKTEQMKRKRQGKPAFDNSALASWILLQNGVTRLDLMQKSKEARISRLNGVSPAWDVVIVNQSLASLDEKQVDRLLGSLDMSKYLQLLEHTYVANWCNSVEQKAVLKKIEGQRKKVEAL